MQISHALLIRADFLESPATLYTYSQVEAMALRSELRKRGYHVVIEKLPTLEDVKLPNFKKLKGLHDGF